MFSFQLYKMLHLIFVLLGFIAFSLSLHGNNSKLYKILAGVSSLMILVTGMGFLARLGIGFQPYIIVKILIWAIIAIGTPVIIKRFPKLKKSFFTLLIVLFCIVAYLVSYTPWS